MTRNDNTPAVTTSRSTPRSAGRRPWSRWAAVTLVSTTVLVGATGCGSGSATPAAAPAPPSNQAPGPATTVPKPGHGGKGPGQQGGQAEQNQALMDAAAAYIGIETKTLRSEGQGKSLAQVAQAHGKDRDGLIAALTKADNDRIDKDVADKKTTQPKADAEKSRTTERVTRYADQVRQQGGKGGATTTSAP